MRAARSGPFAKPAMLIEICSRAAALALSAAAREKTAIISVTSTDEPEVSFPVNGCLEGVLRLRFNDLTREYDDEGLPYGRPLPAPEDFHGLRAFLDRIQSGRLIVHCWEGASRSAAVAAAVYEYRGQRDTLMTHGVFAPNTRVYAFACLELGIPRGDLNYMAGPDENGCRRLEKAR